MSLRFQKQDPDRASGWRRLFQVIARRFPQLFLAGIGPAAAAVPGIVGFFAFSDTVPLLAILVGALSGGLAGPFYGGMYHLIYLALKSEPGYFGVRYRAFLSRRWKSFLLPGAGTGGLVTVMLLAWWQMLAYGGGVLLLFGVVLADMLLLAAAVTVSFHLRGTGEQRAGLRAVIRYIVGHLGPVCRAAAQQGVYWLCACLLLPYSLLVLPGPGIWFPALLGAFTLYEASPDGEKKR